MKTVIQIIFVTAFFGGAAATGTLFWQKHQAELQTAIQRAETAEAKAAENPLTALEKKPDEQLAASEPVEEKPEPPVAVRPPFVEGVDETSQLVVSLNQRLRATHEKERALQERQESLKLIFADIRAEQSEINKLRHEADEELGKSSESVREAMKASREERDLLRQEIEALRSSSSKRDDSSTEAESKSSPKIGDAEAKSSTKTDADPAMLKRLGTIYDSMPAEAVAEVLQQLGKQGRHGDAVQILLTMKDRQAAKVLATIAGADPAKAAALTEKIRRP